MTDVRTHTDAKHRVTELAPDAWEAPGLQVGLDITVEVALSVMSSARARHLFICDGDDRRTGLVTRAGLAAFRDSPAYTDRVRLHDVVDAPQLLTPRATAVPAVDSSEHRRDDVPLPVC